MPKSQRTIVKEIISEAASAAGVTVDELLSKEATQGIIQQRHAAVRKSIEQTALSLAEIGRLFGLHHTTVIYIKKKMRSCTDVVSHSCDGGAGVNPVEKIYAGCGAAGIGSAPNGGTSGKRPSYLVGYAGASRRRSIVQKHSGVDRADTNPLQSTSIRRH